ncbi:carboxypeptidase M32 [Candidatus Hodarchaeum mangrovi]
MKFAYKYLLEKYKEIYTISSISSLLYWDMNTYMPSSALEHRTNQFNWLQQTIHKKWTSKKMISLINQSEKDSTLNNVEKRNVFLLKRAVEEKIALPIELVGQLAIQSNKTLEIWKIAKKKNNFSIVQADLKKLFELEVEKATLLSEVKGLSDPYEALVDIRDPGFTIEKLNNFFSETKRFLIPFVEKCTRAEKQPNKTFLTRFIPQQKQENVVNELVKFLEYDFQAGRVDEVEHPLTIACGPKDVRLTVKYKENEIMKALLAGSHECGHSLHAQQRNPEWIGQPVNGYTGPSFGESQSRILENHVTLSPEFWNYYYPKFKSQTGVFNDINQEEFYFAINATQPGPSRIGSDELTYAIHIIIRFELEQALYAGKLEVADLPQEWNKKYEQYLGVKVESDTQGVMQDLHWYSQYWGYFYGYAMGDIIAAQLINRGLTRDLPEWHEKINTGKFTPIRQWLANNIHSKGVLYDGLDMVKEITGEPLTVRYFIHYLENKYSELYEL